MGACFLYGQSGGAGINFKVVGGTVQPQGKENLIWVNTSTPISIWVVSTFQPESAFDGMVWIVNGTENGINILKKNAIGLFPSGCRMYRNGKWEAVESFLFRNGEWVQFSRTELILFRGGVLNPDFGGFGDATIAESYIQVIAHGDSSSGTAESHSVTSGNAVDLTYYNKFVFTANAGRYESSYIAIMRGTEQVIRQNVKKTSETYEIDISGLSGLYNIKLTAVTWSGNDSLFVYEAHFES